MRLMTKTGAIREVPWFMKKNSISSIQEM